MIFDCFLGAGGPDGFADFFTPVAAMGSPYRAHIIKSGPGCGKSSMIKRVSARLAGRKFDVVRVHCSSDPASLDGVLCPALGFALLDGTSPHVLEPSMPAACQSVISLYDCLDAAALEKRRSELEPLLKSNARLHFRAGRFISAAASLCSEVESCASAALLGEKLERYANNLAARLFREADGEAGRETVCFTAAATPDGIVDYAPGNMRYFSHRYVLRDRNLAAARAILKVLRDRALACGFDVFSCRSFLSPCDALDALFIPAASLCFVADAFVNKTDDASCRSVHCSRFYDRDKLKSGEKRLAFCRKACLSLLDEACGILREARGVHDAIEDIYKVNVDFALVRARENKLCEGYGI